MSSSLLKRWLVRFLVLTAGACVGAYWFFSRQQGEQDLAVEKRSESPSEARAASPHQTSFGGKLRSREGKANQSAPSEKRSPWLNNSLGRNEMPLSPDPGGTLTHQIVDAIGMDVREVSAVQSEVHNFREKMTEMSLSHMTEDELKSDESTEFIKHYRIRSFEEGKIEQQRFRDKLAGILGEERALHLSRISGIDNSLNSVGKNEVLIKVYPNQAVSESVKKMIPEMSYRVSYSVRNPQTGKQVLGGGMTLENFNDQFMTLVEIGGK